MLPPPRGDAVALTAALVAVDSRNPVLAPDAPGEGEVARLLADILTAWGFRVALMESAPNRPNVVARIGRPGGRTLMFNGHLDTVGVAGMTHPPFEPVVREGNLFGRGSCDMKGGVAAMCAAAALAADAGIDGEIIVAGVTDEEWRSAGTSALIAHGVRADAAIVTEPTRLAIGPAHRGFAWAAVTVHGVAAHGSRYDVGVDANTMAGHLLAELDAYQNAILPQRTHPLLGRGSFHAARLSGGIGLSTYADTCRIEFERRTLPGENGESFAAELRAACDRVAARDPRFRADVEVTFVQASNDIAVDAPIARTLARAVESVEGTPAAVEGLSYWTDAALLSAAGIPAICYGPGDIRLAHSATEWVPVDEVRRATAVLAQTAVDWFGGA
ncbi:MAG: ArgE/DapE family deacylase [Gemmatimonadaceae bacterium]|nr:ArgE/DapE family deacylase [Gemmatimonadaceae bacterium]